MFMYRKPTIYIGFDEREGIAYEVLRNSILKYTSEYNIIPLFQPALRRAGLYRRAARIDSIDGNRVMVDELDGRPFSTQFTFTRFLIPALNQYDGWALFMDSDMMLRCDIGELFDTYTKNEQYAIQCVKHDYRPNATVKMDGQVQQTYNRKNWSSFMLWNCSHPGNLRLTVDDANVKTGSWLHGLSWLEDEEIGNINEEWNWLDGWSPEHINAKNVHFTTGGPWFKEWEPKRQADIAYAGEWHSLKTSMTMQEALGEID